MAGATQTPRDMREWMRTVERRLAVAQRSGSQVAHAITRKELGNLKKEVETDRTRRPAPPVEIELQSAFYMNPDGVVKVRVIFDFPDVTMAMDGRPIEVRGYELWGYNATPSILEGKVPSYPGMAGPGHTFPGMRPLASTHISGNIAYHSGLTSSYPGRAAPGVFYPGALKTTLPTTPWKLMAAGTESTFRIEDFIPGSVWNMRLRAIGLYSPPGMWSEQFNVHMLEDDEPLPQPTAPTAVADRGVIRVSWDGQAVTGTMPADFSYAQLAGGNAANPINEIWQFPRGGGFFIHANVPYYEWQHYRVRAVDESGNVSPWSSGVQAMTSPLVNEDIILSEIDGAETTLRNIDAGISIKDDTVIARHLKATVDLSAKVGRFLKVDVGMLKANEIWADEAWLGFADAYLIKSDMFVGKQFFGGTFTLDFDNVGGFAHGAFQTHYSERVGVKMTREGIVAYGVGANGVPNGVETVRIDSATGDITALGGRFTGSTIQTSNLDRVGVKIDAEGVHAFSSATNEEVFTIDAETGNVILQGTITSGIGENQVYISDQVYRERPGIVFRTGSQDEVQPVIQSIGTNADWVLGYPLKSFIINGVEREANSSGRVDLALYENGNFDISQHYGDPKLSQLGLAKDGEWLDLKGRHRSFYQQQFYILESPISSAAIGAGQGFWHSWTFTAPPTSKRKWFASAFSEQDATVSTGHISAHSSMERVSSVQVGYRNTSNSAIWISGGRLLGVWA
jgi:hypothetical protein